MVSLLCRKKLTISDDVKNQQPRLAKSPPNRKQASAGRPRLRRVSDEMKRLSALLEAELREWEDVTSRPMFGMMALYRNSNIFVVLPRTRTLDEPNAICFRLRNPAQRILARLEADERIIPHRPGAKWISFVLQSELDLRDALQWLALAYRQAGK